MESLQTMYLLLVPAFNSLQTLVTADHFLTIQVTTTGIPTTAIPTTGVPTTGQFNTKVSTIGSSISTSNNLNALNGGKGYCNFLKIDRTT